MSHPYDTTLKHLLADFPDDWVRWLGPQLGLPAGTMATPLDTSLSKVQFEADKVFRLEPEERGLLHLEVQSSWDGALPARMNVYNALLHDNHGSPVYSVVVLLRRHADSPALTGVLSRTYPDGNEYLRFRYWVLRAWELPAEALLAGGLGTVPLALLSDDAEGRLPELVARIDDRLKAEGVGDPTRLMLLAAGYFLLGMRYNEADIAAAFMGVRDMEESVTYQAVLRRGEQKGELKGLQKGREEGEQNGRLAALREVVSEALQERFGSVPQPLQREIRDCADPVRLQAAIRSALRVASLDKFRL